MRTTAPPSVSSRRGSYPRPASRLGDRGHTLDGAPGGVPQAAALPARGVLELGIQARGLGDPGQQLRGRTVVTRRQRGRVLGGGSPVELGRDDPHPARNGR